MNTENNKIIAEFMDIYLRDNNYQIDNDNLKWMVISANSWINEPNEQHFDFHSDWTWLMEVVEKIKLIYDESCSKEDFRIRLLLFIRTQNTIFDLKIYSTKEVVYNACVEFIKWYNEQNK